MMRKMIISFIIFLISGYLCTTFAAAQYYEDRTELVSLDLKGMDIRDVLKILSQKSGLNIVADSDVTGTVSLYVKDVDPMQALDIVVSTNALAYKQEGTLVRVMTDKSYEKIYGKKFKDATVTEIVKLDYANATDVATEIRKIKTKVGKIIADDRSNTIVLIDGPDNIKKLKDAISGIDVPLSTEIFSLDYAKAEEIKEKLEQMITGNIGSVKFDERTNKVVVKDTPEKIAEIKRIIEAFDEKTQEVTIDANIIQVTLSDKYSYGIDWADIASLGDIKITGDTNLSTGLTGTNPSTLTIATTGGNYSTVVNLLKTFGKTNVLSRPRITVADNEEARILVGAKEVYVTSDVTTTSGGTYHTTDHVQFVDVGVRLVVTPEINKAGYVKLKIRPEVSSTDSTKTVELKNPDGSTRTVVPYVTTSEAETTVVAKDNTTLIIGGLMKDTVVDHTEGVPFLSDLPLVGKLFSTKGKSKEKTELVIFLTPHIIEGDVTTKEVKTRMNEWDKEKFPAKIKRAIKKEKQAEIRPVSKKKQSMWTSFFGSRDKKKSTKKLRGQQSPKLIKRKPHVVRKTPYEEYYLMVREDINSAVRQQDVSSLKGEVELQFSVDKEGFVVRGPVVLNKPDLKLVRLAVNAVKQAMPFPPLPKALRKDTVELRIMVRYE